MDIATNEHTCIADDITFCEKNEKIAKHIEIYCDSSYNFGQDSYIGCCILVDGEFAHQSTTKIEFNPKDNQECERAAIKYATDYANLFFKNETITVYNDSLTLLTGRSSHSYNNECKINFKYVPRNSEFQWVADKLSKEMMYHDNANYDFPVTDSDTIGLVAIYEDSDDMMVGCQILKKGQCVHQSTTKIYDYEESDLFDFPESLSSLFTKDGETAKIYDESFFNSQIVDILGCCFKYYGGLPSPALPKCRLERFSEEIKDDIITNQRNFLYVCVNEAMSTNKWKYYNLVIASPTNIIRKEGFGPITRGGNGLHFRIAKQIYSKLSSEDFLSNLKNKDIEIENSYLFITNELSGLTFNDYMTNTIIPLSINHKVIGDRHFYSKPIDSVSSEWVFKEICKLLNT
jgi:hypothetical protein